MNVFKVMFFAAIIITAFRCNKDEDIIYEAKFEQRFVIPSGLNTVLTHYIKIQNVYTDCLRKSSEAGIAVEDIKKIQASYGKLRTLLPNQDLDFLQDISIMVVSRTNSANKLEMYYSEFVPFSVDNEIRLQSGAAELKEIISEDYIDLELRLNIRGFVPNAIEVVLDASYIVY